ncbi:MULTISPECIES: DUF3995 domain-containing protein [Kitasatospora]|uniref:DUF3995 domain-containing protein n=1 Tax=Kitasatospora setae (strain ATCC 33774 / DSM 43861 / JCM 3304 / KCC A-0304 / NBRC 14216 / KM-6054) TaxID=452652 RepID=E4N0R0_KITSK|nr:MULTISPECIES: DUF3995 domain-containing protein [Kitasatospora]BAJ31744.1 hypothetical protein KSE_59740 [Kitasatospora setae KM-6054]
MRAGRGGWGYGAAGWAGAFAAAHVYWAVGGSHGLAVSAGERLAAERPGWFVAAGLWGVAAACLAGAGLGVLLARAGAASRWRRAVEWAGRWVGVLLLARGALVEVLLLTDATGLDGAVSRAQRAWTLELWNPWFLAGGVLFWLAARALRRSAAESPAGRPAERGPGRDGRGSGQAGVDQAAAVDE